MACYMSVERVWTREVLWSLESEWNLSEWVSSPLLVRLGVWRMGVVRASCVERSFTDVSCGCGCLCVPHLPVMAVAALRHVGSRRCRSS